jgi:hypothetical protein
VLPGWRVALGPAPWQLLKLPMRRPGQRALRGADRALASQPSARDSGALDCADRKKTDPGVDSRSQAVLLRHSLVLHPGSAHQG